MLYAEHQKKKPAEELLQRAYTYLNTRDYGIDPPHPLWLRQAHQNHALFSAIFIEIVYSD